MTHCAEALATLLIAGLAICGCSTPDANPPSPRANTGYVDFYTATNLGLSWEIKQQRESSGSMRTVYSDFEPVQGTILRLASPPGDHSFEVWILNRATTGPCAVDVRVEDGKVTPVQVTLVSEGTVSTDTKEYRFGGSSKGYARGSKIVSSTGEIYRIDAVPGLPQAYQPKARMPYWSPGAP